MGPRAEATGLLRCVGIGSLIGLQVSNGFGKVWTELRSVPGKPKFSHRAKGTMNLKNLLLSLALISGYVCQGASPVPIAATAILDTPPNFNGGAGAGLLTDGVVGGNNWLSTPWR